MIYDQRFRPEYEKKKTVFSQIVKTAFKETGVTQTM